MLGNIGWSEREDLSQARFLDPCIGEGAFIVPAVEALIASLKRTGTPLTSDTLGGRLLGVEVHRPAFLKAREAVGATLLRMGIDDALSMRLQDDWLRNDDFLLRDFQDATFTHVVANPPYLRWSKLPQGLSATYRSRLPLAWTSGDLSVAFIAKMIDLTANGGRLALLSSDRWMHAAYAERFREQWLRKVRIDRVEKVNAREVFQAPVSTYPLIAFLTRADTGNERRPTGFHSRDEATSAIVEEWMSRLPSIMQAGCEIRVGPALGHDKAFVGGALDVEEELLIPFLRSREIVGDGIAWEGGQVISVHSPGGGLIDLQRYPRTAKHLARFRPHLEGRACVKRDKDTERWYRTIDRVDRSLWARDKILVPEIYCDLKIALDEDGRVPSHSLYAIFSERWPLSVLRDLLASGVLGAVMDCIAPRIRGGCKRCYKRFLSRLPLPQWDALSRENRQGLAESSAAGDRVGFTERVADIYGVEVDVLWPHATHDWRGLRDRPGVKANDGI
ncbi:Modification methylase AbrI [Imhoffiella purpurea]|uniref:site-specific DNA-methyltransferase (adenine-specific) n=2 Tax=Imhoffiella purpurea TaxID=1249627 RepID=W9VAQ3_9GAMM|nr:Modification methylase AbrI [Imhoffiella purpurea]